MASTARILKRLAIALCIVVVLVGAAVGVVVYLVRSAPAWWSAPMPDDPALAAQGEALENRVVGESSRVRPRAQALGAGAFQSDDFEIVMSDQEATAWLNTRLADWLANQEMQSAWPNELRSLQVRFVPPAAGGLGGARVEAALGMKPDAAAPSLVVLGIDLSVRPDGSLWMNINTIDVGRMPVPRGMLLDPRGPVAQAAGSAGDAAELLDMLTGRRALVEEAIVDLGDGRRLRMLGLSTREGGLVARLRTEK